MQKFFSLLELQLLNAANTDYKYYKNVYGLQEHEQKNIFKVFISFPFSHLDELDKLDFKRETKDKEESAWVQEGSIDRLRAVDPMNNTVT